jgi:type IV pilus assembly protein PilA
MRRLPLRRAFAILGVVCLLAVAAGLVWARTHRRTTWATTPEMKANLKALYASERSFWQETDRYSTDMAEVGFAPERGNRYAYFAAEQGEVELRAEGAVPRRPHSILSADPPRKQWSTFSSTGCPITGVLGVSKQGFLGAAAGYWGDKLDCWSIATYDRTARSGAQIPAGMPWCETP